MSDQTKDGGPAFPDPCGAHPGAHPPDEAKGMTLRDYFAAKAMQSLMEHYSRNDGILSRDYNEIATESFCMTDAMLTARATPQSARTGEGEPDE